MKKLFNKKAFALLLCLVLALTALLTVTAFADTAPADGTAAQTEETADSGVSAKAIASGIAIGVAAAGGAIGMGMAIAKSAEGIARQPEAEGKIRNHLRPAGGHPHHLCAVRNGERRYEHPSEY